MWEQIEPPSGYSLAFELGNHVAASRWSSDTGIGCRTWNVFRRLADSTLQELSGVWVQLGASPQPEHDRISQGLGWAEDLIAKSA